MLQSKPDKEADSVRTGPTIAPEQLADEPKVFRGPHACRIQLHHVRVPQLRQRLHLANKGGSLLLGLRLHPLDRHAASTPGGTVHHTCRGISTPAEGWLGAAQQACGC